MGERELDLVVLGATGVTGRQVVRYLAARSAEVGVRWAVAGRDPRRLNDVLDEVAADAPAIVVDVHDERAVRELVRRVRVVANLVGPYARHGAVVYTECAAAGTHEVDVCGELDWVGDQLPTIEPVARSTGARIVPTAGFEALPFDLAALALAEECIARFGQPVEDVDIALSVHRDPPILRPIDLVSGGTLVSGAEAIRRGTHAATGDARLLDPDPHDPMPFELEPRRHPSTGAWLGPMVPSPYINPVVAHRTVALVRQDGRALFAGSYRYRDGLVAEGLFSPFVPASVGASWLSGAHLAGSWLATAPSSVRSLVADVMEGVGPRAGQGPDDSRMAGWTWRLDARATTPSGETLDAVVLGDGHPGYRSTGNIVGEAALLLAEPSDGPAGVLTPAVAFGTRSLTHFERAGVRFSIRRRDDGDPAR